MRLLEPNGWIVLTMSFIVLDKTIDAEEDVVSNIYCVRQNAAANVELFCQQVPPRFFEMFSKLGSVSLWLSINKFFMVSLKIF